MTSDEALVLVEGATSASALLGNSPHEAYRRLIKLVHPDRFPDSTLKQRAERAFVKLKSYFDSFNGASGTAFKVGDWKIIRPLAKGSLCDLYYAVRDTQHAALKIVRSPDDNDLMEAEANALRELQGDEVFKHYFPRLLDSFIASDRQVNVQTLVEGHHSLADIKAYGSISFRHVVWMMNRLLSCLGFLQSKGIVHGAILPEHLLYNIETHGMVLVDWCYSCKTSGTVPAIVSDRRTLYPPEILAKKVATTATDIYMASQIVNVVDKIPARFQAILEWMRAESSSARPLDAWDLVDRWKALAVEEYGPPAFVKLELKTV